MDAQAHRRRLQNLSDATAHVNACARKHFVEEYLAGQVTYNLGEYPKPYSVAPTEYDERLLTEFAEHGVSLIQLHEEWNDSQRRLGASKYSAHDPEGLRKFVDLVHDLGMKIIVYVSTGYFESTDPDFDPAWTGGTRHLVELYFDYARCSPASPEWRAYLFPRLERILDEYGVDGLYDDLGYTAPCSMRPLPPELVSPGPETAEYGAALEDLLGLVRDLVRSRNGVLKIHGGGAKGLPCRLKLYDYLWVGESVTNADSLREDTLLLEPYVVPCLDMSRARIDNEDELYLHAVPHMQFPLRVDGRPCTGERAMVEGMNYRKGEDCFWTRHMLSVWRRLQEQPDAPSMYGWWDSSPGRPEARSRWLHHLDLYLPMAVPGTHVWIDITNGPLFASPKPDGVTASLFVNTETWLVLANYGRTPAEVATCWTWKDRESGVTAEHLTVPSRDLLFLERVRP